MIINSIDDINKLKESYEIEIKKSFDSFPIDALETYSAFANGNGGYIILGLSEDEDNKFSLTGVSNSTKIRKEMFDLLNNRKKVSINLINDNDINEFELDSKKIIVIYVPSAKYSDKPIYLNNNRSKSYYRLNSSDFLCTEEMVDAMIRDSSPESFDSTLLKNFDIEDLDKDTITKYRNYFAQLKPGHPFNNEDDSSFLIKIGALSRDRSIQNKLSPTIAGLLMFGKHSSIIDRLPHFHLEYIDKREVGVKHERWKDRVIYDGSWGEGNLYNFFFTVIPKLNITLQSEFQLEKNSISRKDETPMKIALRELLVNSIIHNDFQNTNGIIITRYNDRFEFTNGGSLRVSKEQFFTGGYSEPRNHLIHKIFFHINLCERAGSGIPKVMDAVKLYNLVFPKLYIAINYIVFDLYDISIIESADNLNKEEKKVLAYIFESKYVTRSEVDIHFKMQKNESIKILNSLISKNYIQKYGKSVDTKYTSVDYNKEFSFEYRLYDSLSNLQRNIKIRNKDK